MKSKHLILFFIAALLVAGCQKFGSKSPEQPVLFTMGDESVYVDEFKYVYEKHNSNSDDFYSHNSVHEYLDLYTNFRLKIKEAEALKMDTAKAFIDELAGHRKILAKPYLTEKEVSEKLIQEAYDRMQEEVL
jgi:peptidyl-prolyl cis-trans isomerase SurA